jgi:hypothetical protein
VKLDNELSDYKPIKSGVPQGSVLGPFLYLIFTAILTFDLDPRSASAKLQNQLDTINGWFHKWRICVNTTKSVQITFTTKRSGCPQVNINNRPIPVQTEVKYLGLYLDEKLTWEPHIKAKRRQLDLKIKNIYWLPNRKSKLFLENKLIIYKHILQPIWTYGIELWGCSKPSNTKILKSFQSKTLRMISGAPWYVSNQTLHEDLKIPQIQDIIKSDIHKCKDRTSVHENRLIKDLFTQTLEERRLLREPDQKTFLKLCSLTENH